MTWALHTELSLDDVNLHWAALEAAGVLGIAEEGGRTTIYLPERVPVPIAGRWVQLPDRDWNEQWKAGLEPIIVGRIVVRPPWKLPVSVTGDPVIDIVIEPAQAFGTGHHETTAHCLAALQDLPVGGCRVLDVGTGSGVLAIAAALLGAVEVMGVDTDPLAVEAARANVAENGTAHLVQIREGSMGAVEGPFDLILANLDTDTVCGLAGDLERALAPGGAVSISGISNERVPEAVQALETVGFVTRGRQGREWALLTAHRSTSP